MTKSASTDEVRAVTAHNPTNFGGWRTPQLQRSSKCVGFFDVKAARATMFAALDRLTGQLMRYGHDVAREIADEPRAVRRAAVSFDRVRRRRFDAERAEIRGLELRIYMQLGLDEHGGRLLAPEPQPVHTAKEYDARVEQAMRVWLTARPSRHVIDALRHYEPMMLWAALRLDLPPSLPSSRRGPLTQQAADRRRQHDDLIDATTTLVMSADAAAAIEYEAAKLRYLVAIERQVAAEAMAYAKRGPRDATEHEEARLIALADVFDDAADGWADIDIARLVLASSTDWRDPPCPRYVAGLGARRSKNSVETRLADRIRQYRNRRT